MSETTDREEFTKATWRPLLAMAIMTVGVWGAGVAQTQAQTALGVAFFLVGGAWILSIIKREDGEAA